MNSRLSIADPPAAGSVAAVVLARTGSRRAPCKVLEGPAGRSPIEVILRRIQRAADVDKVVVATTDHPSDDPVQRMARRLAVPVVRGSRDDVVARLVMAARLHGAEYVVRLNADSPFVDVGLVSAGTQLAKLRRWDLVSNIPRRTFPYGMSLEIVRVEVLAQARTRMTAEEREHVTQYLYRHPDDFRMLSLSQHVDTALPTGELRGTIDTPADVRTYTALVAELGDDVFTMDAGDLVHLFTRQLALETAPARTA